ncbi:MAG: hypothetical protein AAGJ52_08310 [Pseudomonadota bacterium]
MFSMSAFGSESRTESADLFADYGHEAQSLVRDEWTFYLQSYARKMDARSAGDGPSSWLVQARWSEALLQDGQAFTDRHLELVDKAKALIRQASDAELVDLLTAAEALPAVHLLSRTLMGSSADFQARHPEFSRLVDLFQASPLLQQLAIDLWWDERSYASLLFSADELVESAEMLGAQGGSILCTYAGVDDVGCGLQCCPRGDTSCGPGSDSLSEYGGKAA